MAWAVAGWLGARETAVALLSRLHLLFPRPAGNGSNAEAAVQLLGTKGSLLPIKKQT